MSLILEALRKLERERPAPERGVVVMTSAAWGERSGRSPWLWLSVGLAAGIAAAAAILEWRRPLQVSAPATVSSPASRATPASLSAPAPPSAPVPVSAAAAAPAPTPRPSVPPATQTAVTAPRATVPSPLPAPALVLQAITVQDGRPVALISDRLLREGDEIDGVRIVRIGEAEVEIEVGGQRSVLRF